MFMRTYSTFIHFLLVSVTVLSLGWITLITSCDTTEPPPPPPPPPKDPRTYTWTYDTLAYPGSFQTLMWDIWASSPTDIYVVGHNDLLGQGTMYHFDGTGWASTRFHVAEGGPIVGGLSLSRVFGFDANNIYVVGERRFQNPNPPPNTVDSSLIIRFDGITWREHPVVGGRSLRGVWGRNASDIWVGGLDRTMFHFDGSTWSRDSVSVSAPSDGLFQLNRISGHDSSLYALGSSIDYQVNIRLYYFFERRSGVWAPVDSFTEVSTHKWGAANMWATKTGGLYSSGLGVFRMDGNSWIKILPSASAFWGIHVLNCQSVFSVGDFGKAYHYDGTDWFQFTNLEDTSVIYTAVWAFENEAFIVGIIPGPPQKTIVLHGR